MDIWNVVLVLLAVVVLVLLLLTVGIIRKLNELTERTAVLRPALAPGMTAPPFEASTATGAAVHLEELPEGGAVLAFLAPGCPTCRTELAELDGLTRTLPAGAPRVVAVVDGTPELSRELLEGLDAKTPMLVAFAPRHANPTIDHYKVTGYPRYVEVEGDGTIATTVSSLEQLRFVWADRFAVPAHGRA
jgi:peroxiredoxin